jgi:hypothetical protein
MSKITTFMHTLAKFDYILFSSIFIIFLVLMILAIILREKLILSISLGVFSFVVLFVAPFVGYFKMHDIVYKHTVSITSEKKLNFTKAVVVYGTIKNESKRNFKACKIKAQIFKQSKNKLKNFLYQLKSYKQRSITKNSILKEEIIKFKILVEPFLYEKDYSVSIGAVCR